MGYGKDDVPALAMGAWAQQHLLANAPREITESGLENLYLGALRYW